MWVITMIVVLGVLGAAVAKFFPQLRTDHMSREEVIGVMERFLAGTARQSWEWDDFVHVPLDDPELEAIRAMCASVPDKYASDEGRYCSEAGMEVLRAILHDLRDRQQATR